MRPVSSQITELLRRWSGGDPGALEQLLPIVYKELHRLAAGYMKKEFWLSSDTSAD